MKNFVRRFHRLTQIFSSNLRRSRALQICGLILLSSIFHLPSSALSAPQTVYVTPDGSIVNTTDFKFKAHKLQICDAAGANCVAVDTELDGKQDLDTDLTAIAGVSTAPFGRNALAIVDAPAFRAYIGAGTSSFSGAYSALTGIPSTFAPSAHTHPFTDLTGTATAAQIPSLDAAKITTGTIATARLGSGTANSGSFLRGDQTWTAVTVPTIAGTADILKGDGAGNAIAFGSASGITTFLTTPTLVNLKTALTDETTVGWNLLTLPNPGAITFLKIAADNSVSTESASAHRTSLGLAIGTNVQAWDTDLDTWAGITPGTGVATFLATPSFTNFNAMTTGDDAAGLAAANVFTGNNSNSYASTASTPAMLYSGTWLTGGTGTTNFPHFLLQATGTTASTTWSTTGTGIGVNAVTGFTGNLMDLKLAGASKFTVSSAGNLSGVGTIITSGSITNAQGSSYLTSGRGGIAFSADGLMQLFTNGFAQSAALKVPADGVIALGNSGVTDFTRLDFGGTTNSFNAIGRDAVNGFTLQSAAGTATWNDPSTANSGTVANRYLFGIAAPTLTATGTSVTNTVASTVYIGGAPTDSTNTTSTTKYALNIASGITRHSQDGIGATATDVIQIGNATAAAAGAQQYSPAVHWTGQGWKTNATAASQPVDFRAYVVPVQGTANPDATLVFDAAVNGGAFATRLQISSQTNPSVSTTDIDIGAGRSLYFGPSGTGQGRFTSNADGQYGLIPRASAAPALAFGGFTSSFPEIKRNSASLQLRLADDSGWTDLSLGTRNATNNTVTDGLTLGHQLSSGTAAAGLGEGILFNLDSSTTADQNAARAYAAWTDATHATRTAKYVIQLVNNAGALADALTISGNGTLTAAGDLTTSRSSSGAVSLSATNTNSAGNARVVVANDTGNAEFGIYGTTKSAYGMIAAGEPYLYGGTNLNLMADFSGVIKFAAGGATEIVRISSAGLKLSAGEVIPAVVKTTTYTVTGSDYYIIGNHATVAFTITMIAASSNTGRVFKFKNKGAASVTIDATGLGQIFGTAAANTRVLATGDAITLTSDGATWVLD